jgi:hypothetical protein
MKKFYTLTLLFIGIFQITVGQSFTLKDLMEFSGDKSDKLTNHILRKDYRQDFNDADRRNVYVYSKQEKGIPVRREIEFNSALQEDHIAYKTTSAAEKFEFEKQIIKEGFVNYDPNAKETFLQKDQYTLHVVTESLEDRPVYSYSLVKRQLPKISEINFAEDLLMLNSHEYIAAVFGADNVVKETFHFSETETSKCSVLFPGTPREAIFIWNDQHYYRDIDLVVLGGSLNTMTTKYLRLPHNQWRSKQGVHAGMPLKDLELLNGGPVSFYGWASEMAGILLPSNAGNLNFKKLGLVLNCLNCEESATAKMPVVNSKSETDDRRIYVTTLIMVPEKQKQVTALR